MKKNIILITGGAGFIGSCLIKYLINNNIKDKIISIDNYSSGLKKNHLRSANVKYIKGENKNYKKCFEYNIHHSSKVIEFAKNNKIKIIYSATSSNLGNDGKDENLSPYAWSKSKNIELIKNYNKWFGLKYEFVYFYNVYGPGQILNSPMAAVIGIFERQFKKNKPLTVVKPGTQRRDFTHIDDIVKGCYLAWKKGNQNHYMLGTKKTYSIIQIAKMFNTKIKYLPKRPGERFGSIIPNNNARNILGYTAKKDIRDYIKSIVKKK